MGVRIVRGTEDYVGAPELAMLYCSVSMWAFGPVFRNVEQAEAFLDWLHNDPRRFSDSELRAKYHTFLEDQERETKPLTSEI